MKIIKDKTKLGLAITCFVVFLFAGDISAQILHVDSVTVDSVWISDSTWYDGNGILQQRISRDCRLSFIPQGEGAARIFVAISVDSGRTWASSPNPLVVPNNALFSTYAIGQKASFIARVLGGDRPGVVFKITARQAAPVIVGNPKLQVLGLTTSIEAGQNVNVGFNVGLAGEKSTDGFCTLSKVYWDTLCDGTIDDSTSGTNMFTWTWKTQVPTIISGQKRNLIARAIDKNGLWSVPETLVVQFGRKMVGVWELTAAYDQNGSRFEKDIGFPITAFQFGSDNSVVSTGGPMFLHCVYGGSKYTTIASKIDQVFNYASLDMTGGEWFIDGGDAKRFTIEIKLEGLPGQKSFVDLLSLLGIGAAYLETTIYHKFMDVKVTFDGSADSVMVWEFDSQTTAVYSKKDKYGNYVLWNGWPVDNFEYDRFVFHKRSKGINDVVSEAMK